MNTMNKNEIDMFVAKFKGEMKFDTKKQEYNFKQKMNEYSKRDSFNLTYELFKLCIEKDKQLANRPAVIVEEVVHEVKPKTNKELLQEYQQQIENIPSKYTKPTQMEEFHDLVDKMDNEIFELSEKIDEDDEELCEEVDVTSYDLTETKDKIINKFGVAVDDWTWWDTEKKKNKMIYSPQSYKEYMESIDTGIKDGNKRLKTYKQELLENKQLKDLLKSFKK
jgi:hypothetical protein